MSITAGTGNSDIYDPNRSYTSKKKLLLKLFGTMGRIKFLILCGIKKYLFDKVGIKEDAKET